MCHRHSHSVCCFKSLPLPSLSAFRMSLFCFGTDCLFVSLPISACPYVTGCPRSVSGRHLSQGSPPRLPPLPRQRAALPLPLCSPPVWPFTASSVSISTAAPPLTKDYSRSTGKGNLMTWVCAKTATRHSQCYSELQFYWCIYSEY